MKSLIIWTACLLLPACFVPGGCAKPSKELERPEKIVSKRLVVYDQDTYRKLAGLWADYYDQYPSEDAYANWMYAARYAEEPEYEEMLKTGLEEYPANPTLAYLMGLIHHGASGDREGEYYLERALELDPGYVDAWFGLVGHYMSRNDNEKLDVALRHILESGVITDEIMDYMYNMMALLERNAILITNGDNDTYPGWILGRIIGYRPDVTIVNRSLLNTDWYPGLVQDTGVPKFILETQLESFRSDILQKMKEAGTTPGPGGPFGDTLISRLVMSADRAGRPVYFAATLYKSDVIDRYREKGQNLGLVALVNPGDVPYRARLKNMCETWLHEFRTAGIDGWGLRNASDASAGKQLAMNYPASIHHLMEAITRHVPEYRLPLFRWYREHIMPIVSKKSADALGTMWCDIRDIQEIRQWCDTQGFRE